MPANVHKRRVIDPNRLPSWVRETTTLLSGTAGAQAITVAAYFFLTRIYGPDDFGLLGIFCSVLDVLIILSTCKYELSIVASDSDREASAVAALSLRLNAIVSLLLLAVTAALVLTGALPGKLRELGPLALLIPPMIYFSGTSRIYENIFNRRRKYSTIAGSEAAAAATTVGLKAGLGLAGLLHSGLPIGTVLGRAAGNIVYRLRLHRLPSTTRQERRQAAVKHRNYPLFVAPKDFAASLSTNLPLIWLAQYADLGEAGFYSLAIAFTFRPVNIINVSVEKVLYSRAMEHLQKREPIWPEVRAFLLPAAAAAVVAGALLFVWGGPLFGLLFGAEWVACGYYIRCLLPWVMAMLLANSLMYVSNVFSTQSAEFMFCLVGLALRAAGCWVGIAAGSFRLGILLFGAASCAVSLALLWWYLYQVRRHDAAIAN
ncbi:MAG: oligosaccharide flippase family protein [Bacteroidales bacterium]|nr:oligosaccharide flippase family protein [Bacteroidales bacterium]